MRPNRALRLIHTRGSRGPAFLSRPDRVDHVEVVEIASMEVVLFWDIPGPEVRRFVGALRADLATLDEQELLERWSDVHSAADVP